MASPVGKSCAVEGEADTPAATQRPTFKFGSDVDSALEAQIDAAALRLCFAPVDQRPALWREFAALVGKRSVNRVRFMERIRGLA